MSDEMPAVETSAPESVSAESSLSPESPSTTETSPAPAQEASVWDSFKGLPDFEGQDEASIARSLYQSMEREKSATRQLQQYQQLIPYAQEYLQHRDTFEQWRSSQNQAPAPQPEPEPEPEPMPWAAPDIKPEFKRYLVRDEQGRQVVSESAPLDARYALENYLNDRAEFAQKFLDNPQEALGPMIQQMAERQAQELIQAELSSRDEQAFIGNLEKENADWLYEQDGQTPTAEGLAVQKYIQQAASLGITGAESRWEYATAMVERDLLDRIRNESAQAQQRSQFEASIPQAAPAPVQEAPAAPPPVQKSAEEDMNFLRREASRNPSRAAGSQKGGSDSSEPMSFEARLKAQLQRDNLI